LRVAPLDGLIIPLRTSGVYEHNHQMLVLKSVQYTHLILVVNRSYNNDKIGGIA